MTLRMMISLGTASSALIAATPALAQQEMNYEERVYEYARPAPQAVTQDVVRTTQPIVFTDNPVVQSVPQQQAMTWVEEAPQPVQTVRYVKDRTHYAAPVHHQQPRPQQVEHEVETVVVPHHGPVATRTIHTPPPVQHAAPYPHHAAPQHNTYAPPAYAPAAEHSGYDREAWLDECRDRIRGRQRGSNGGIIGGLLGAIAGGVIGNRISSGERLAGTLIGGGIGGLAGLAVGSLIGGSGNRDREECEDYLFRWESQQGQHGYQGHYGYAQQYTYTMVPVTVAVPQRAIVTEYVTTEYVTEYVTEEVQAAPVRRRVIHTPAPAPRPTKRQRYIKRN